MATITCKCGAVRVDFPAEAELFRHQCCCYDCISALWYASKRGGPQYPLDLCADCCWLPNDFAVIVGKDQVGAFMNYASADTTRFYCRSCWTVLFGDHPLYERRILVSQVAAYREFEGLTHVRRMAPQARHFISDLSPEEIAALPPWTGDPSRVYPGVAANLLENFPLMKAAGGPGERMNAQILRQDIGGVFIPSNEPRLSRSPPSLLQQAALRGGISS